MLFQKIVINVGLWVSYLLKSVLHERLHFHFLLSCIAEGNGNPLQCSCLENPRDGGAWWAARSLVGCTELFVGSHRVGHD